MYALNQLPHHLGAAGAESGVFAVAANRGQDLPTPLTLGALGGLHLDLQVLAALLQSDLGDKDRKSVV